MLLAAINNLKYMEITWHGDTCFTVKGKEKQVVIDPNKEAGHLKGNMVLLSSSGENGNIEVEGSSKKFDWPGEYEMGGIPIMAFLAWTKSKSKEEAGEKGDTTLIFRLEVDGIKICHLGEVGHVLTSDMVNEIGDVDVLMIKAGKDSNLDTKKATEIIEAIEPRIVIAMGSNPESVLKDLGVDKIEKQEKFVIKAVADLPETQMQYVLLAKV
ncbi:MAG: MBL fold metallo-hydrolase [Patescibacteria group bacterium]